MSAGDLCPTEISNLSGFKLNTISEKILAKKQLPKEYAEAF